MRFVVASTNVDYMDRDHTRLRHSILRFFAACLATGGTQKNSLCGKAAHIPDSVRTGLVKRYSRDPDGGPQEGTTVRNPQA